MRAMGSGSSLSIFTGLDYFGTDALGGKRVLQSSFVTIMGREGGLDDGREEPDFGSAVVTNSRRRSRPGHEKFT